VAALENVGGRQFRVTTQRPHLRQPGDRISLHNVFLTTDLPKTTKNIFNGEYSEAFLIERVDSTGYQFEFTLPSAPPPAPDDPDPVRDWVPGSVIDVLNAFAGAGFVALTGDNGVAAVVEGNRVFNCAVGGPYHDTSATRDITVRHNYYGDVWTGPTQALGPGGIFHNLRSLMRVAADNQFKALATVMGNNHFLESGYAVDITGASNPVYNGRFIIKVISDREFEYDLPMDPGGDSLPSPGAYARAKQVRRLVIEDNVMELQMNPFVYGQGAVPQGIVVASSEALAFHQFLVRGNVVRISADDRYPVQQPLGITLWLGGDGLVEHNVLGIEAEDILRNELGPAVQFFNNRRPDGALVRSWNTSAAQFVDQSPELATEIEDAMTLALLKL
jgi:hypothetical protein